MSYTAETRPLTPKLLQFWSPNDVTPATSSCPLVVSCGPPLSPEQGPPLGWLYSMVTELTCASCPRICRG